MNKVIKIVYSLTVAWAILIATLVLNATITFGHGLGDVYYLLIILFFLLVLFVIAFKIRGSTPRNKIIFFLIFVFTVLIFFTLKLTVYRGAEYPWNGQFFLN